MQYPGFHFLVLMHLLNCIYIIRTPHVRPSGLMLFLLGLTTAVIVGVTCLILVRQVNEGWLTYYLIAHFFLGVYAMGAGLGRDKVEPKPVHVTSEFEQSVLASQQTPAEADVTGPAGGQNSSPAVPPQS